MNRKDDLVLLATGLCAQNSNLFIDRRCGRDRRGEGGGRQSVGWSQRRYQFRSFDDRRQASQEPDKLSKMLNERERVSEPVDGDLIHALYRLLEHLQDRRAIPGKNSQSF
ncbi:hypothetical protein [Aestuariispira insulae]|uniref:Uncharacterized protein n=1 Tax=Aestuariispira insulae TaxID=1461337 RepID=A0A3D9H5A5_9PROT|nr:hypothetical protein [Aestuariispira insulae]RED44677.1 hypothetical protein DFP90_11439 [Aestuariispira insulae]